MHIRGHLYKGYWLLVLGCLEHHFELVNLAWFHHFMQLQLNHRQLHFQFIMLEQQVLVIIEVSHQLWIILITPYITPFNYSLHVFRWKCVMARSTKSLRTEKTPNPNDNPYHKWWHPIGPNVTNQKTGFRSNWSREFFLFRRVL